MMDEKKTILIYDLTDEQEALLKESYGAKYEIKKTDCFTDILAIPAMMVVVNPEKLTWPDINQMNEVFKYDFDTLIIFTQELNKDSLSRLESCEIVDNHMTTMMHYVSTDLKKIDRGTLFTIKDSYLNDYVERIEDYPVVLKETKALLNNINNYIMPDSHMFLDERAGFTRNRSSTFKHLYELIQYREESKEIHNVPFRYEILNVLLALKLAYGMIDEESPLLAPGEAFVHIDKEWVLNLAEQLKARKNNNKYRILRHYA